MVTVAEQGKVSVFECLEDGRAVFRRQWTDHGCIEGVVITVSPDDQFVACGYPGGANVYRLNDTWHSACPLPVKTVNVEGARVNQLAFNATSELLAVGYALNADRNAGGYKLLHLRSMSLFSNFPGPSGKMRATSLSFSPGGKFLAVGQYTGRVALFSLGYYNTY